MTGTIWVQRHWHLYFLAFNSFSVMTRLTLDVCWVMNAPVMTRLTLDVCWVMDAIEVDFCLERLVSLNGWIVGRCMIVHLILLRFHSLLFLCAWFGMVVASLLVVGRYLISKHYDHRVCYGNFSVGFLIIEFIISYKAKHNEVWCRCANCASKFCDMWS